MTASPTSKTALDGVQNQFPSGMALESVSGNFVSVTYVKEPVGETIVTPALDGTDGTGITPPTGGVGLRGWNSGIYKLLSNPLTMNMNGAQVTVTPTVTVSGYTGPLVIGGIQTFAGILNTSTICKLQSIALKFKATKQTTEFDVAIFSASPAGTYTDHLAPVIAAADSALLLGVYKLVFANQGNSSLGTHTIYNLDAINKKIVGTSTSLFAVVVCVGTLAVTPVSASEMSLTLAVDW